MINDFAKLDSHSRLTRDVRRAKGREVRREVPRSTHGTWDSSMRTDNPMKVLDTTNELRVKELIPLRYERMAQNPFSFYRAGAAMMASDLSNTPFSGAKVQACGDAHLGNFGGFATPERRFIFDLNDFDETLPGPWEWDVKRFAVSVALASQSSLHSASESESAILSAIEAYKVHLESLSHLGFLDVFLESLEMDNLMSNLAPDIRMGFKAEIDKQAKRDHKHALRRMTEEVNGKWRIVDDPPIIEHTKESRSIVLVTELYKSYRDSLAPNIQRLLDHYRIVDVARRVVGVGSVGTRCWVAVLAGSEGEPLFLQVKEAQTSVLEPYFGKSPNSHGERVVIGQRLLQSASDLFLGWGEAGGRSFYLRQLWDRKAKFNVTTLSPRALSEYVKICGHVLARAHARTGDSAFISGYIGDSDSFAKAICQFAMSYAEQVKEDYGVFMNEIVL